jgi:hypothetical protein
MPRYRLSLRADKLKTSSAVLEFLTSTPYLRVTQAASLATKLLVVVLVLAASLAVTVTPGDAGVEKGVVPSEPTPFALAMSVTVEASPWVAVKVHEYVPFAAIAVGAAQVVLAGALATLPGAQFGPEKPDSVLMLPYAVSQI